MSKIEAIMEQIVSPKLSAEEQAIMSASKIQLPKHSGGHLSPSQITMYWRCGEQYRRRYVLGIKNPPAVALVEGGSHHDVLDTNNKHKVKTGKDRSAKFLCNRFYDTFNDRQKEIPRREWRLAGETKDDVMKRGGRIMKQYCDDFAPLLKPEFAETEVTFKVGGVEVKGIIDVGGKIPSFCKNKGVWDYKVTSRRKPDSEVENALSLSHYGWGAIDLLKGTHLTINPPQVGFCILKAKSGLPEIILQSTPLRIERIKWYRRQVLSVADAISRGAFPVRDGVGWECSRKFCGYYDKCKGKVWRSK